MMDHSLHRAIGEVTRPLREAAAKNPSESHEVVLGLCDVIDDLQAACMQLAEHAHDVEKKLAELQQRLARLEAS
jgi:hypothetical protein